MAYEGTGYNPDVYGPCYFRRISGTTRECSLIAGRDIANRYHPKSLVDFGCGCGFYLEAALECGVPLIKGFDIASKTQATRLISPSVMPFIERADVMTPIDCGKFDCAMSIEVGEHLLKSGSEQLVINICNAAERLIFFTAAPPTQNKGVGHINCQPHEWWIGMFKNHGWGLLEDESKKTQDIWRQIGVPWYLINNIKIFAPMDLV